MKNFSQNFYQFMQGRHGFDKLNKFLVACSVVFLIFLGPLNSLYSSIFAIIPLIIAICRALSKNRIKRSSENYAALKIINQVEKNIALRYNMLKDFKTHKYVKCKQCKNMLRLPRKKGTITAKCPVCSNKFETRT